MLSKQGDHPVSRIQQDDRRTFLRQGAAVASASMAGVLAVQNATGVHAAEGSAKTNRLPREVWIATIAQDGMRAGSPKQMVDRMLEAGEKGSGLFLKWLRWGQKKRRDKTGLELGMKE